MGGGLVSEWPVSMLNSTVAGNYSAHGGAVMLAPNEDYLALRWPYFEGTIIAGNSAGATPDYAIDLDSGQPRTVFGANNLVGDAATDITLPADTLRGNPKLLPLADNGGRTQTMAPAPSSPVIDAGSNLLGLVADQRGGSFVRVDGSAADIGAYEVQPPPGPAFTLPVRSTVARPDGTPSILPVTSCAEDGSPGTLRAIAAVARDGETIDLTQLACSTITLEHGPVDTSVLGPNPLHTVTFAGPGQHALTVSGHGTSAVFVAGSPLGGTLTLSNLTVAHGTKYDAAACVSSFFSSVVLESVTATDCHTRWAGGGAAGRGFNGGGGAHVSLVDSTITDSSLTAVDRNVAAGGGLWARYATLTRSTISGNSVTAPVQSAYQSSYQTAGGGIYTSLQLVLVDSTITGNSIEAAEEGQDANGGGVAAQWALTLNGSTICDNTADGIGGGVLAAFPRLQLPGQDAPQGGDFSITNSTITGNRATLGSAFAGDYSVPIVNSTIAFNTSTLGGAVAILDTWPLEKTMNLDSTIIANNAIDGPGGHAADITASSEITLTVLGANNLVGLVDPNVTLPADTLRSDPLLLPLADNGGPTWTMALAAGSPALDAGANPLDLASDQRGDGYVRESGAAADIGAYEAQIADAIFIDGFEP